MALKCVRLCSGDERWGAPNTEKAMNRPDARILLVDDIALSRVSTHQALRSLGFRLIEEAASGAEALALLAATPFDLVISNWRLADLGGRDLLRAIRKTPGGANTPVVVVTPVTAEVVSEAAETGVSAFLPRPIASQPLDDVLRVFIGGPAGRRSSRQAWTAVEGEP